MIKYINKTRKMNLCGGKAMTTGAIRQPHRYSKVISSTNGSIPHNTVELTITSFNMLAPCYKRVSVSTPISGISEKRTISREASFTDQWQERADLKAKFLLEHVFPFSSIVALQEYWMFSEYDSIFQELFKSCGYELYTCKRSGGKADAVAIGIQTEKYEVVDSQEIILSRFADRVGLLLWVRMKQSPFSDILLMNTHLTFPHTRYDRILQMKQIRKCVKKIEIYAQKNDIEDVAHRFVVGDFNAESASPVCDYLRAKRYSSCFDIRKPENIDGIKVIDVNGNFDAVADENVDDSESRVVTIDVDTNPEFVTPKRRSGDAGMGKSENTTLSQASFASTPSSSGQPASCSSSGRRMHSMAALMTLPSLNARLSTTVSEHSTVCDNRSPDVARSRDGKTTDTYLMHGRTCEYVSHRNHEEEEVGVDHIFVRPATIVKKLMKPIGETKCNSSGGNESTNAFERVDTLTSNGSEAEDMDSNTIKLASSLKVEPVVPTAHPSILYISESYVLPRDMECLNWKEGWVISDHRPVFTKLLIPYE